jgi:hypothetical protein
MSSEKLIGSFRGSLVKKVYGKFKSVFHFILPVFEFSIFYPELFISFLYKCGAPHSITIIAI